MQIGSWIAMYFILWWVSLFLVLPFGQRSQTDAGGEIVQGTDPGAPVAVRFLPKLLITSVVALVLQFLVVWGLSNPTLHQYWS